MTRSAGLFLIFILYINIVSVLGYNENFFWGGGGKNDKYDSRILIIIGLLAIFIVLPGGSSYPLMHYDFYEILLHAF